MAEPKTEQYNGEDMHFAVGAIMMKDGKYLLMDRSIKPFGFAGPAGHVDVGETAEQALRREIKEETGLNILKHKLLFEGIYSGEGCVYGVKHHHWRLYTCEWNGRMLIKNREWKSLTWYSKDEIKKLKLDPSWKFWFKQLNVI